MMAIVCGLTWFATAWLIFQVLSGLIINARFSLGWYGARCYEVIATMVVLPALLCETTALYAKLCRSVVRERDARDAHRMFSLSTGLDVAFKELSGWGPSRSSGRTHRGG